MHRNGHKVGFNGLHDMIKMLFIILVAASVEENKDFLGKKVVLIANIKL